MGERDPKSKRGAPTPSSLPPERVSHTTISLADEAVSSSRSVQLRELPAVWVDRLLLAIVELPVAAGEDAVVSALVEALGAILQNHAVGACFVPSGDAARQVVFKRLPVGGTEGTAGMDPTRLFPGYTHERVFEVPGMPGSTLHVAGDDAALDDDRSPAAHLARRAGAALGQALGHVHALAGEAEAKRELGRMERHVIQADKLASFGEIAAGLVHELNNPLTSIVAYTDFLIKKSLAREAAAASRDGDVLEPRADADADGDDMERLRRISDSANRMLRFTRDLVTYARPSGERKVPVVLHSVIDQALAFCEHVLHEAGVSVERRYGADVLTVRGLAEQLVQVFVNLVTNACHAMPPGGRLVIWTAMDPPPVDVGSARCVRIEVEDNGHGIAGEHLTHVFAPFFTTKGEGRGTGLGLSIVKNIVEHHDGEIHAESEPQRGSRFVIRLPAWRVG